MTYPKNLYLVKLCWLLTLPLMGQNTLQSEFEHLAKDTKGTLGVSAMLLETGASVSWNGDRKFPMQSVYKFPIAMVMLHQVEAGRFSLEDTIVIDPAEYIPRQGHSPLRDQFPEGAELTISAILEYNISQSDGTACDVLLRLLGGPAEVEQQIHDLGVNDIAIATTEMVQVAHDTIQYRNWSTPAAMNELLSVFFQGDYLSEASKTLLLDYMSVSTPWFDRRIKGRLPAGTEVAHKTGTAGTYNGLTRATNDVGIIFLPDGNRLAISVFIADSYDSTERRESIIAQASQAAYDHWVR